MNPKYSIPTNHLLKVTCSPEEYLSLLNETSRWFRPSKEQLGYLPSYTIARCPFCNAAYATYIDTHSILPWYIYDDYRSVFKLFNSLPVIEDLLLNGDPSQQKDIGCHHLFAFQTFFHLQGNIPVETERFSNIIGDVPYVMPIWLPDDLPSMAVREHLKNRHVRKDGYRRGAQNQESSRHTTRDEQGHGDSFAAKQRNV
jgi:hypothetical protein